MGSFRLGQWSLIVVHVLLMQMQPVEGQGDPSVSQKLRQLNEQFKQFRVLTKARLDMLALNQNTNSSRELESRVQALTDHYDHLSQDLEHFKQSTTQEIEGLREWSKKFEKKTKRMEGRLALMERNLRENRRHSQKQRPDLYQDFSNFTLELYSQEEKLAALQVQRDELLIGLKGLHESLKNQELRVSRLEGQIGVVLQGNGWGNIRESRRLGEFMNSKITPQDYMKPRTQSQTHRGGRNGRILEGHTETRPEGISYSQIHSQATPQYQYRATHHRPKHSKPHKQRPQPESHSRTQVHLHHPEPDAYRPQSQIQVPAQSRPHTILQEQLQSRLTVPYHHAQVLQPSQPRLHRQGHAHLQNPNRPSWPQPLSQTQTLPEPTKERPSRLGAPPTQPSDILPQPRSQPYQPSVNGQDGEEEESTTKVESSVIPYFLQLPLRQKIPAWPVPKKDATICNVDSMLFFPSASAKNYVNFSLSLPNLPELSVCLWLRVDASYVGTLLSYATNDNDNQLVLYGRNPSASSTSFAASSSSSHHSYSSSYTSSPSLDFVIGDPAYRRLPVSSLLDARWHHLCVLWSSIQGRFWHYTDRRLSSSGSNFRKGLEIPGGGSVVLGQEQDTVGGGFDPAEGFVGQVAGFRVWNRVLSPPEVEGVADGRGVPRGVVLGMEDIKEVHGEVQQVACECLEHCV